MKAWNTFPRVRKWRRPSTLRGRLRAWFLLRVLGYCCETCDRCGGRVGCVWWCQDDALWRAAYEEATGNLPVESEGVDGPLYSGLLCPRCFEVAGRRLHWGVVQWVPRVLP